MKEKIKVILFLFLSITNFLIAIVDLVAFKFNPDNKLFILDTFEIFTNLFYGLYFFAIILLFFVNVHAINEGSQTMINWKTILTAPINLLLIANLTAYIDFGTQCYFNSCFVIESYGYIISLFLILVNIIYVIGYLICAIAFYIRHYGFQEIPQNDENS